MLRFLSAAVALALTVTAFAAEPKPVEPFTGKDLKGWVLKNPKATDKWLVGTAAVAEANPATLKIGLLHQLVGDFIPQMICTGGGTDISTEQKFGDCTIELEFMVPKGSNSGIYLMGEYEIQILDSFGKAVPGMGDLGAIYSASSPRINMAKKPGEWQKFIIEFQAPKFEGEKKVENAKVLRVNLNGMDIQENVVLKGPTPGGLTGKEAATGPLMFQGDHGAVAFRKIRVTPTGK